MTAIALKALAEHAKNWARAYVTVTEALRAEGVTEDRAREEARTAANFASLLPDEALISSGGPPCPLCGRPEG